MLTAVRFLEVLALGLWLGGMVFFSFLVAPAAFAVLPTRQLAGELVTVVLARLYVLGTVCGAGYLVTLLVEQRLAGGSLRAVLVPGALVVLMLLLTFSNQFVLAPQMVALRNEMKGSFGGVDETPVEHPLRVEFNRYHRVSVALMAATMLLGVGVLFLTVRRFG